MYLIYQIIFLENSAVGSSSVIEHLPSLHNVLGSIPYTTKKLIHTFCVPHILIQMYSSHLRHLPDPFVHH